MNPFDNEDNNVTIQAPMKIEIWVSREKNKKTTYISGLTYDQTTMKEHLKNLKKKHGCNGSIKKEKSNTTKTSGDDTDEEDSEDETDSINNFVIQLQGDHIDNIYQYFTDLGINNIIIKGV
jgi:translation initiation factor 1 (eIF-1/SUI1)